MSFNYPPERVVTGVRDFLIFELHRPIGAVKIVRGDTVVVNPKGKVPKKVEEELRKILPPGYKLIFKE